MPTSEGPRRRRRGARSRNDRRRSLAPIVSLSSLLLVALLMPAARDRIGRPAAGGPDGFSGRTRATGEPAGVHAVSRPVYPHSVVPGGVFTPQELRDAAGADAVVAAHYAGLRQDRVRVERVRAPRRVYVSYRLGDGIYWTKQPVPLHQGERVLTDGVREIRARCGNGISEQPMQPVSDREPNAFEFDRALPPLTPSLAPLQVRTPAPDTPVPPEASAGTPGIELPLPALAAIVTGVGVGDPATGPSSTRATPLERTPGTSGPVAIGAVPSSIPRDGVAADPLTPSGGGTDHESASVPEPGAMLLAIGLAAYAIHRRRQAS